MNATLRSPSGRKHQRRRVDDGSVTEGRPARKGLPPEAYEVVPGNQYRPYVPAERSMAELTVKAVVIGGLLAVVFGAANAYLGLRAGLTVSASVPAAVMAVAVFRTIRRGTILETNVVQTIGSAGEAVAAGVIFTLPALFIWQRTDPTIVVEALQISLIAALGGVLGVAFMIPLRRYLISREHGKLPYPEGTACAEVQVAGDMGGTGARLLFSGLGIGALFQAMANRHGLGLWNAGPHLPLPGKAQIGGDFTPELVGVGFIVGPRIAAIMFSGAGLAWLVLIPAINAWGGDAIVYPATTPMNSLTSVEIWDHYVRYIGAGAVGFAGVVTLIRSVPTISESLRLSMGQVGAATVGASRTQQDLPMRFVIGLAGLTAGALWLWPGVPVGGLGAGLIVVFSLVFVTVSSRIVGLIGSTSNPISGMTIAALLLTSLIWVALGLNDGSAAAQVAVLAVGAVVCIAAAVAGDTSQDSKTSFLVGATPARVQSGQLLGVLASATVMGGVLLLLNDTYGIGTEDLPAPQPTIMARLIEGVLNGSLPWSFVVLGMLLAAVVEFLLRLPSLAFAVGVYLPVSLMTPILIGGLIRMWLTRKYESTGETDDGVSVLAERREQGVLYASGLIAGSALVGVLIAAAIYVYSRYAGAPEATPVWQIGQAWTASAPYLASLIGTGMFAGLCWLLWRAATREVRA